MTGEQLYAAYCAALWVDWPHKRGQNRFLIMDDTPAAPVAWPFLNEHLKKGWDNLAQVLTEGGES